MRRLRNSRAPDADGGDLDGSDLLDLEGDPIEPAADEIGALRPFGRELAGAVLVGAAVDIPEADRVLRRATELVTLGRRLDAVRLLRQCLEESPGASAARVLLAEVREQGGDTEEALSQLTAALRDASDPLPILVRRCALFARTGRSVEGDRDLRQAIRQQPAHAPAHLHLGLALLRRGLGADAAVALREALRLGPEDPEATYYLGEALSAQGDLRGALGTLQRAAVLSPNNPRSYKLMGRLLDRLGRTEEAMVMYRKAREVGIK